MIKKQTDTIAPNTTIITKEYAQTLSELKKHIAQAQIKAVLSANKELIKLYWHIGKTIIENRHIMVGDLMSLNGSPKIYKKHFPG